MLTFRSTVPIPPPVPPSPRGVGTRRLRWLASDADLEARALKRILGGAALAEPDDRKYQRYVQEGSAAKGLARRERTHPGSTHALGNVRNQRVGGSNRVKRRSPASVCRPSHAAAGLPELDHECHGRIGSVTDRRRL
jgi:hypothetical protein